jgi:PAS domain S-box-containing protein
MPEAVAPSPFDALIGLETHILDRVEAAVMAIDLSGTILFANRYVERLYGWSAEELIGRSSAELSGVAVSPKLAAEIMEALEAGATWEGTFDVSRKDGSVITVRAIDSPLYDKAGQLAGVVSVGIDGSRERAVESMLQQQATIAAVFRELGETLLEHHDPEPLLQAVIDIAAKAVGAELGAFFYSPIEGDSDTYVLSALSGAPREAFVDFSVSSNTEMFETTFRSKSIVRVDDVTRDPRYRTSPPFVGMTAGHLDVTSYLAAPVVSRSGDVVGGLFFGHGERGMFTPADEELLGAIATQAGVAIDNAQTHTSLEGEIAARRRAQQIEHFLARCAVTLSSSLDYQRNFLTLAEMAVPFLADACVIDVAENEQVRRVAAAHADPAKRALVEELEHYAPDPRGGHPALQALWEGTPSFSAEVTDEFLRRTTRDERHYQILTELGFSSFVSVPMTARGRTQGALSLMSCSPDRRFDDRDVAVATELAKYAAVALDNAWLYKDQQRARAVAEGMAERLRQLQALSADLSRAVTVTEVAAVIRGVSLPGLDAPTRGLWLLDEVATTLRIVPTASPRAIDASFDTVPLDAPLPAAKAVRTDAPVFLHSLAARDAYFPTLRGTETVGRSFAVLPLHAQHRVIGALALGFPDEHPFDDDERRFLVAVAEQCAQALSRALLYDRERIARDRAEADRRRIHELNSALQTSLLPPSLPDIPGLEVSARYQPALAGLEVGGDFYDVFDTGGDWAVVVGDVCGKGPEAAAVTATARWTIRSVAMDIRQPAQVLRKLNETMIHQQLEGRFCTLAYTRVVPTSHGVRISVCRGGHPAPLVLRANGEVEFVGTPGSLIGVFPDVRLWEETVQLDPGDTYIAYTDGVTEARRNREQFGDERLAETISNCTGLDADSIAAAIESAVLDFGGAEPSDDLALIVLRVPPA